MLGFNLEERFERMFYHYNFDNLCTEDKISIENEFGDDIEWFKNQDENDQKEIYLKLQEERKNSKIKILPLVLTCADDTYATLYSDKDFNEMIQYYIQEGYKDEINIDDAIICALSNLTYLKKQDITNSSIRKRISGCYDMIKIHIKNGYNIYPLIEVLNKNVEAHKKKYPNDCEKGGIMYDRVVSDMNAIQTLELLEMHSPYVQFINASNKLGEFIREQNDLEKQEKYNEADKVGECIERLKEQLRDKFKSYDLDFLESFLNDRKNHLKNDSTKQEEYIGALETLKTLVFHKKRQANVENEK